jgi:hypothetical protein
MTLGLALSGLIGLVMGEACAESITMTIEVPGHSIVVDGTLVTSQSSTDFIVNTTALNQVLTGDSSALQFSSLAAHSNFPGDFDSTVGMVAGVVSQSGLVQIPVGAPGSTSVTITVSEDGFTRPTRAGLWGIDSFTRATFENTAQGDSQQLTSIYNGGPSSYATLFSTGPAPNSSSAIAQTILFGGFAIPYSVTNIMSIALTPNSTAVSQDQFFGKSIVTPEPPGMVILATGMFLSLVTMSLVRASRCYWTKRAERSRMNKA